MNFYIGDTHLGHTNCIKFDNRPFESIEEMNRVIVNNWNNRVSANDDVWIIGDFCYRSDKDPAYFLKKLKGHKHLIVGNHDKATLDSQEACRLLESIDQMQLIKDGNENIVLCHFPIAEWNKKQRGSYHIYAHIHNDISDTYRFMSKMERALNAGCMINGFQPVTFRELIVNNKIFKSMNEKLC